MTRCQECGRTVEGYFDHITADCLNLSDEEVLDQMEEESPGYKDRLAKLKADNNGE